MVANVINLIQVHLTFKLLKLFFNSLKGISSMYLVLRLNDPAYFSENLNLSIFVFLSFMWSQGNHSS